MNQQPGVDDTREWVEALYGETGPQLLCFLAQRVGNRGTAEDLLQETFAAALRHPERLRAALSPRAYLFGIARNLAASSIRQSLRPMGILPADLAVQQTPPDARLELVRERIAKLKPDFREALELRLQQELSYEEMAEALGIPIGTVRSRLHGAVNELRRFIHKGDVAPVIGKERV